MIFLIIFLTAIFLAAALPWSLVYIFRMKKDVRKVKESLQEVKSQNPNMRLQAATFSKDVGSLAREVNELLDQQQGTLQEFERTSRELKGITDISHDLRSILISASGYIGLIKSNEISGEQKLEYLNVVEKSLTALANLTSELYDYMQMVDGKIEFEVETVDLGVLVHEEIATFSDALAKSSFEVSVDVPEEPIQLITAPAQLQRVVHDLVGNVLEHGANFLKVKISSDGVMTFTNKVANVEGFDVAQLFEQFYTSETTGNSQKTELGLAVTKTLVEKMGGKISASLTDDILSVEVDLKLK